MKRDRMTISRISFEENNYFKILKIQYQEKILLDSANSKCRCYVQLYIYLSIQTIRVRFCGTLIYIISVGIQKFKNRFSFT